MTRYQQHVARWRDCDKCSLCHGRSQIVPGKGTLPCDVLFIGEAPGISEDALGVPFVGPAGHLLDQIVERALLEGHDTRRLTVAFTNIVACFPREQKDAGTHAPPNEAIEACAPRLREFVELVQPKLVVCVGALAEKWAPKILQNMTWDEPDGRVRPFQIVAITHPAHILARVTPAMQGIAVQKCVVAIADAVEEVFQ